MRVILYVFRFLFALFSVLAFIVSLLLVTPVYILIFFFGGKNATVPAHRLSQLWGAITLLICGGWLKVHGRELLDPKEAYVFVSNHQSQLDIPVSACSTRHIFKFLAKDELRQIPLFGYIISHLYIMVDRSSMRARVLSMQRMESTLAEGISVWIYPEGTRNKTNEPLGPFFDGAFQLAIAAQRPIAVLTIAGSKRVLPPDKFFQVQPGLIKSRWSPPLSTKGMTRQDVPLLRERVRALMLENLSKQS